MNKNSKIMQGKKLRVCQVFSGPAMGGTENQLLAFLQRYDRDKFIIDVACLGGTEGALQDKFLATSTRLITCRWSTYVIPFFLRFLLLLWRERYDVIHARMSEVSGAAILAARVAGVPNRICSYHHTEIPWRKPGLINRFAVGILQWIVHKWATKILGITSTSLDVYHKGWRQNPEKYQVCYNGIDIERFSKSVNRSEVRSELSIPKDSRVVGHIGSFRTVKNHKAIIEIAEHISKKLENVLFLLVGGGQLRDQIESEVKKRNLDKKIIFAGIRKDVPRLLAAMDVFILPSLNEGLGSVVIEAQLRNLPIVASDLPSIREVLCPEMHRFCCDPLDSVAMAKNIELLLSNPQLRSELGQLGRAYSSKKFSICKTVQQLESLYAGEI